jgi:hypothetical protein
MLSCARVCATSSTTAVGSAIDGCASYCGPKEGLTVRKRSARHRAIGTRTPILVEANANARWSLEFVHDQLAHGRRFRILNVVDDVTRECLAAIPDTISGKRVVRGPPRLSARAASRYTHRAERRNIGRASKCLSEIILSHVNRL